VEENVILSGGTGLSSYRLQHIYIQHTL